MCGIAGILNKNEAVEEGMIRKMSDAICHRGPDSDGFFIDHELAFGHRRLAILDLSDAANQPFTDASGRYTMIYNGEIYNFRDIKPLLDGYPFKTSGDTEVILAAYIKWGAASLEYLRGMFTIVIWDREQREMFIARDRLGVKPLYYFHDEKHFVFASEIRGVLASGLVKRQLDPAAIGEYFRYQSIGFPYSGIAGIRQVQAGSWMKVKQGRIETKIYWGLTSLPGGFDFSDPAKVKQRIRELLLQSVQRRLVSDVPLGAFLSGGIDSSAVVGLMREAGDPELNTFNISFDEKAYDESQYADLVAAKFNTHHTRIHLKPETMLDELEPALRAMDIPSGDGINTYVVSKAVRKQGITVALSGVGGDELFAGYPIFTNYLKLQERSWFWKIPQPLRMGIGQLLGSGSKKNRMRQMLQMDSPAIENVYPVFRQLLSPAYLKSLTRGNLSAEEGLQHQLSAKQQQLAKLPLLSQVSVAEYIGYTQNTLLKDTDQMSMASSLEVREPFFDQDLVEYVLAIPDEIKKPAYPKSLLVESLQPMLPGDIVFRKKQGFVFPWNEWMKNELQSFCEQRILRIAQRDFIQGDKLLAAWRSFLVGNPDIRWQEMWLFVILEYWMEKNEVNG
jgi:asparagine synthase (glutamine-hydrolysing)